MDETAKEIRDLRMDFNTLNINLTNFIKIHESQMEEIRGRQKDHHENIYGTASSPGLRMDLAEVENDIKRIKDEEKSRKTFNISVILAVISLFITTLWKLITGK